MTILTNPVVPGAGVAPVAICVAPNGARKTRSDHPALPMSSEDMVRTALACAEAGATALHLHVRDDKGGHSLDVQRYREVLRALDAALGQRLLVQVTTEAVGIYQPEQQRALLRELHPQAASVALRELIPDKSHEQASGDLFHWAMRQGVALQYILYSAEDAARFRQLVRSGVVPHARPHALFVLGRYTAGQQSEATGLLPFLHEWPSDWPWSACAFGVAEARCMAAAIALGGHVRIGFENNVHLPDGSVADGNADLVRNVAAIAMGTGRPLASAAETRALYGA
ncbi:3-keto-5-aminohexanoate cleavage protein [Duganella sp. FT92W]|uniref:3-keto-5-aminohexanoate cleavage protein n=1 Tax=Pseudoduganella rivuli TaxID=2666085 RepID=A0A7X2IJ10_9BURK|nr:3-keto-5-aminohexanoate cleavage protein [Pseudoduganella rivuli]MRV70447.1 3-keto-5-aminohexanoate cleavage protein [Pseudoduganella rivuli]